VTDRKMREKLFGQDDHVRKYGKDYPQRIEQAGLKAVQEDFVNTISEEQRQRFGLVKGEIIYRAEKGLV
jgi:hypothetical protein